MGSNDRNIATRISVVGVSAQIQFLKSLSASYYHGPAIKVSDEGHKHHRHHCAADSPESALAFDLQGTPILAASRFFVVGCRVMVFEWNDVRCSKHTTTTTLCVVAHSRLNDVMPAPYHDCSSCLLRLETSFGCCVLAAEMST
jgi:hypothetical protein